MFKSPSARPIRLSEHLARRRILYPATAATAPSVLVIDLPPAHRGVGLALGRYYAIIVENDAEHDELGRFLDELRASPVAPDLLDRRPSAMISDNVLIFRYEPPSAGWPWLSVCRWPTDFAAGIAASEMARGCYTMELFERPEELEAHSLALLEALGQRCEIAVRTIAADRLPPAGHA